MGVPALREAPVPHRIAGAVVREGLVEASRDRVLLRVPNVGRFLVRAESPTLVARAAGAADADLRCFRDETVAAVSAILRGELALRAASVAIGGRAVVLCGASAAGKSALAAALAQRGHAVLADAVSVIAAAPGGLVEIAPVAPDPVLWPDSAGELGLADPPGRVVRPALAKRAYRVGPEPVPSPPAAVAILRADAAAGEPVLEPVAGAARLEALLAASWHLRLVHALGLGAARFGVAARLAARTRFVVLTRPGRGAPVASLADLVEELAQ